MYTPTSLLVSIETILSLNTDIFSLLGIIHKEKNSTHRTKIKQEILEQGQKIIVYLDKKLIVKKIFDTDDNYSSRAKKRQIVELVLGDSLCDNSFCAEDAEVFFGIVMLDEIMIYNNLEGLAQGNKSVMHLSFQSQMLMLVLMNYLIDKTTGKKAKKKRISSKV